MAFPSIPASYFGVVLGIAGLGGAWRAAHRVWGLPAAVGELITLVAVAVWVALAVLYAVKWILAYNEALAELEHPIQCCFVGLIGVSTSLVGLGILPYTRPVATALVTLGIGLTGAFALWRTGRLWRGERDPASTTPILYLPFVAGAFVTAIALGLLGEGDWGQIAFGAGFFSWLAIESVLLHRLYTGPELARPLRPTLGIQLAPPAVGLLAYLGASAGPVDIIAHALLGYAILQALLLARMLSWILQQPFAPSYWAFTFGATALGAAPLRMMERGDLGAVAFIAPWTFLAANLVVAATVMGSLTLLARPVTAALARGTHPKLPSTPHPGANKGD